jgi:hypothetical protein
MTAIKPVAVVNANKQAIDHSIRSVAQARLFQHVASACMTVDL